MEISFILFLFFYLAQVFSCDSIIRHIYTYLTNSADYCIFKHSNIIYTVIQKQHTEIII